MVEDIRDERRHAPARGARTLYEALSRGGAELSAALRDADDGTLLDVLGQETAGERAARMVVELVRRAPGRDPGAADTVCEEVLRAHLYLGRRGRAAADDAGGGLRVRNALMLYEALVRPYAGRGSAPLLMARVLPALWRTGGEEGREVVRAVLEARQPTGFGEQGWKALLRAVAEEGDPVPAPAVRRRWTEDDGGRIDLQPGQVWVSLLLAVIAVALVMIVVLATA